MKLGDLSGNASSQPRFEEIACLRALARSVFSLRRREFAQVSAIPMCLEPKTKYVVDDTIFLKVQIIDNEGTVVLTYYFGMLLIKLI